VNKYPVGFLSYVRKDDEHNGGYLSKFRMRLSGEVYAQTGEVFDVFQDTKDIGWGDDWEDRINDGIDDGTFLICIITPCYFRSEACRKELSRFIAREKALGRHDLILPVYYITCPVLEDESKRREDPLAQMISTRNYVDWRDLRFRPIDSPQAKKRLAEIATDIRQAIEARTSAGEINKWASSSPPGRKLPRFFEACANHEGSSI
jgi:F-box protein 11